MTEVAPAFHFTQYAQAESAKKLAQARYIPKEITWVILPLSTCLPEKIRDTAKPTAIKVKYNPELTPIPISSAYIAT